MIGLATRSAAFPVPIEDFIESGIGIGYCYCCHGFGCCVCSNVIANAKYTYTDITDEYRIPIVTMTIITITNLFFQFYFITHVKTF